MALFVPSLYATDFDRLPEEPIYVLAAIHTIARYLPDSTMLRGRVGKVLRSLKGIAEAYAVKLKLGVASITGEEARTLSLIWIVWLYTMSYHCTIIHGYPRSLSESLELLRAKAALGRAVDRPRIQLLLGECEFFLLWEELVALPRAMIGDFDNAFEKWHSSWQHFLAHRAAPGRQLYFHYSFPRFHLLTHWAELSRENLGESLDAARDFLSYIKSLSPIAKDHLSYMFDFAFRKYEFLKLIKELGGPMQSMGSRPDARPCVYGDALTAICKQHEAAHQPDREGATHETPGMPGNGQAVNGFAIPSETVVDLEYWSLESDISMFDGPMSGILPLQVS
ncbi:hypothetical protein BJY01DRAFT_249004 [Aspergillus pseudoustus]|uniref:Uncharacterized protein n=1 Tax=Aspergillus pseudoustus TaxID=1810923 RepID=A0ABR4JR60_9EURO